MSRGKCPDCGLIAPWTSREAELFFPCVDWPEERQAACNQRYYEHNEEYRALLLEELADLHSASAPERPAPASAPERSAPAPKRPAPTSAPKRPECWSDSRDPARHSKLQVAGLAWLMEVTGVPLSEIREWSSYQFRKYDAAQLYRSLGDRKAPVRARIAELIEVFPHPTRPKRKR